MHPSPVGQPAGLLDAVPADPRLAERHAREGRSLRRPDEPYALRGCVLTPDEAREDAYVVVEGGTVSAVTDRRPAGTLVLETDGVVLPGLLDLHGHPEYNVFSAWEPPQRYLNRYAWRASAEYRAVVREPWGRLTGRTRRRDPDDQPAPQPVSLLRELTRYAEVRCLVGGCTAVQGASSEYPDPYESLVRNVDLPLFGTDRARSLVDLDNLPPSDRRRLHAQIDAGEVTAFWVHLAEGVDEGSRRELDDLVDTGLLTAATVVVHGTALTRDQWGQVADAGGKLVWSPQSNLRLYGATTDVAAALAAGVPVALGADWLPTGSPSLLDEAQVARRVLAAAGTDVPPARLVRMMTCEAAAVAALDEHLGRLEPGRPADLLVLERLHADPWESVLRSDRRAVELVTLGGDVAYGRAEWVEQLAGPTELERVHAWGRPMALDLAYSVTASPAPPPRLADLRTALLQRYPQTGPIFA